MLGWIELVGVGLGWLGWSVVGWTRLPGLGWMGHWAGLRCWDGAG